MRTSLLGSGGTATAEASYPFPLHAWPPLTSITTERRFTCLRSGSRPSTRRRWPSRSCATRTRSTSSSLSAAQLSQGTGSCSAAFDQKYVDTESLIIFRCAQPCEAPALHPGGCVGAACLVWAGLHTPRAAGMCDGDVSKTQLCICNYVSDPSLLVRRKHTSKLRIRSSAG